MRAQEQKAAAKKFVEQWKDTGYEKGETQRFWLMLLRTVFGIYSAENFILFEEQVKVDKTKSPTAGQQTNFIDARIPKTKVLIEQKSSHKDLREPIKQSDGSFLTPYQQAKKYAAELPYSARPRWIVACNFREFLVYDMETPNAEPISVLLKDLPKEYYKLSFLVQFQDEKIVQETEISIKAGEIVGKIYDALFKQYKNPESISSQQSLNQLCVRLVFCLYAEDSEIFDRGQFHDYLQENSNRVREALIELFKVLDQKVEDRSPYLNERLAAFPYVNGGLFRDEDIEIPQIPCDILETLLQDASEKFDWSGISPTIFGAVFESTLNPETRRQGGMHYTSIENIHKVIDPLFLDELREEFETIREMKLVNKRRDRLVEFQKKLGSLTFLDPACGSGNFLTQTYLSLRRLENAALRLIYPEGTIFSASDTGAVVKVSINQFYGIEINDFAVTVAKTALWIAESQMLQETEGILNCQLDFLPLKTNACIVEGNALTINWSTVISPDKLSYIMGNPPFVGFTYMSAEQKKDMNFIFPGVKNLDFVCAWYKKASDYITNTTIEVAFVSTNSITQGETVSRFWDFMTDDVINFAHKTFVWDSKAISKAHVHCVIIGFAKKDREIKTLFNNGQRHNVRNINNYLIEGKNILVRSNKEPICNVPSMIYGNKPADGGNLIIENYCLEQFIKKEPQAQKFIRPLLGATEYINGKKRWCLWLVGASPDELRKCPLVMERIKKCQEMRKNSVAAAIRKFATTPALFVQRTQPTDKDFIIVPLTTSETRRYVPMGFIKAGTIVTNAVSLLPGATLYHFGILTSSTHMNWTRVVCGRLKSDYRYSADVVYNNFPWPEATDEQREKIERTAQGILDARALYPDSSLADLYDDTVMPPELRKAHEANDRAVMAAYGFDPDMTEPEIVAALMEMYQKLIEEK